ncbi:putative anti-sigma factor, partial [Trichinella spiralis]|uniref:putative anti-sigma factor n=1 Tax=Trichinella spiralis TaxID=6334 RepID=UPI0001EFD2A3
MGMHKVRIVPLSPKAVSKQDGIVKVPEETDCSEHLQTRRHRPCQEAITITSRRLEIEEEERRGICSPAKEKILIWHGILEVPEDICKQDIVPIA